MYLPKISKLQVVEVQETGRRSFRSFTSRHSQASSPPLVSVPDSTTSPPLAQDESKTKKESAEPSAVSPTTSPSFSKIKTLSSLQSSLPSSSSSFHRANLKTSILRRKSFTMPSQIPSNKESTKFTARGEEAKQPPSSERRRKEEEEKKHSSSSSFFASGAPPSSQSFSSSSFSSSAVSTTRFATTSSRSCVLGECQLDLSQFVHMEREQGGEGEERDGGSPLGILSSYQKRFTLPLERCEDPQATITFVVSWTLLSATGGDGAGDEEDNDDAISLHSGLVSLASDETFFKGPTSLLPSSSSSSVLFLPPHTFQLYQPSPLPSPSPPLPLPSPYQGSHPLLTKGLEGERSYTKDSTRMRSSLFPSSTPSPLHPSILSSSSFGRPVSARRPPPSSGVLGSSSSLSPLPPAQTSSDSALPSSLKYRSPSTLLSTSSSPSASSPPGVALQEESSLMKKDSFERQERRREKQEREEREKENASSFSHSAPAEISSSYSYITNKDRKEGPTKEGEEKEKGLGEGLKSERNDGERHLAGMTVTPHQVRGVYTPHDKRGELNEGAYENVCFDKNEEKEEEGEIRKRRSHRISLPNGMDEEGRSLAIDGVFGGKRLSFANGLTGAAPVNELIKARELRKKKEEEEEEEKRRKEEIEVEEARTTASLPPVNPRSTLSSPLTDPNAISEEEKRALHPSSSSAGSLHLPSSLPLPMTERSISSSSSSSSRLKSLRSLLPSPRSVEGKKSGYPSTSTTITRTPSRSARDKLIDEEDEEARRKREEEVAFLSRVAQGLPMTGEEEEDSKTRQEIEDLIGMKRLTSHGGGALDTHECKSMVQLLQRISDLERKNEEKQRLLLKAHLALDSKESAERDEYEKKIRNLFSQIEELHTALANAQEQQLTTAQQLEDERSKSQQTHHSGSGGGERSSRAVGEEGGGGGSEEREQSSSSTSPTSYQILREELEQLKGAMKEAEKSHKEIESQYLHRQKLSQQKIDELKTMLARQEEEFREERSSLQSLIQQQGESHDHQQQLLQDAEKERNFLMQKNDHLRQKHEQMEQHVSQVLQQLVDEKEEREKAVRQLKNLRRKLGGGREEGEEEDGDPLKQQLLTLQQEVTELTAIRDELRREKERQEQTHLHERHQLQEQLRATRDQQDEHIHLLEKEKSSLRMRILALEHELSTLHSSSSSSSSRSLLEKNDLAPAGGEGVGGGAKEEPPYNSSKRKAGGGGNAADGSVGCGVHTPGTTSAMEQRQTERRTAEIIEDLETNLVKTKIELALAEQRRAEDLDLCKNKIASLKDSILNYAALVSDLEVQLADVKLQVKHPNFFLSSSSSSASNAMSSTRRGLRPIRSLKSFFRSSSSASSRAVPDKTEGHPYQPPSSVVSPPPLPVPLPSSSSRLSSSQQKAHLVSSSSCNLHSTSQKSALALHSSSATGERGSLRNSPSSSSMLSRQNSLSHTCQSSHLHRGRMEGRNLSLSSIRGREQAEEDEDEEEEKKREEIWKKGGGRRGREQGEEGEEERSRYSSSRHETSPSSFSHPPPPRSSSFRFRLRSDRNRKKDRIHRHAKEEEEEEEEEENVWCRTRQRSASVAFLSR